MSKVRFAACLAILVVLASGIYAYYVYATGQNWDETFHVKGALVSPSDYESQQGYRYAVDHPSVGRYIYRAALFAIGVRSVVTPDVDYHQGEKWNADNGRLPSLAVVIPLRFVNALFMLGAVVLLFFTAHLILKNAWLALLVALPLVLSQRLAAGVVGYLGTDAILAFFLALMLYVWVLLALKSRDRGFLGIVLIAGVAGIAVSTKVNALLALGAYMVYLGVVMRGADRFLKPLLAALVTTAIFFAVNPIMRGGDLAWVVGVVSDMLETRRVIWMSQYNQFPLTRGELIRRFLECPAFLLPLAGAFIIFRKEKWSLPLLLWGIVLAAGTLMSVNRTYARYFMPIEISLTFTGGVMAWRLLQAASRERLAWGGVGKPRAASRIVAALAAGALAALVILTCVIAFEPWGQGRIRRGPSPAGKVAVFYRQAAAFYMLAAPMDSAEIRQRFITAPAQPRLAPAAPAMPLFDNMTRQMISTAIFLAACAVMIFVGRQAFGAAAWGVPLALVFMWVEASEYRLWLHWPSESFFALFALWVLCLLMKSARAGGPVGWRDLALLAAAAGAATAASPKGVFITAAAAAFVFLNSSGGLGRIGRAAGSVAIAAAVFAALEPPLWYLGANDSHNLLANMRAGTLTYWPAYLKQTVYFLMPLEERFPYLAMLPLGACALYRARRASWAVPVALWAGFLVGGTMLTLDVSQQRVTSDITLALTMAAGLPGLILLKDNLTVYVGLRSTPDGA